MVTNILYPRRGRSVYGYEHQPFPFVEEEGVYMAMITTTTPFPLSEVEPGVWAMGRTIPLPRKGRYVYGYDHQYFLFVEKEGVHMLMITAITTFPSKGNRMFGP